MRPILFNTQMVQAILEGRKTVTRRVMKPQPKGQPYRMKYSSCWPGYFADSGSDGVFRPPYNPGDVLYVRETFVQVAAHIYWYKADSPVQNILWRPSIHMPKEAARIFLRVKDVRAEQLKRIRYFDCLAEGIPYRLAEGISYRQMEDDIIRDFAELWASTIKPADRASYGWEANPWVWVIEFEQISRKEAVNERQE